MPRFFQAMPLTSGARIELDTEASHHLARVLRAKIGDSVTIYNGEGGEFAAFIVLIDKKKVIVELKAYIGRSAESPLHLTLALGISRGEKMDYTIQKAVELGVTRIVPLLTERCTVKLDADRRQKKLQHWQAIVVSATEQCGRNTLPELTAPMAVSKWLPIAEADLKLVLAPDAPQKLQEIAVPAGASAALLIGPEGGLTESEIQEASSTGFLPLNLGPRILRTETAAVAALTVLQTIFGDMVR